MKGGSGEVVTLYWPSFPSILVAGCQHEVGGSLDSGELAEVGTSEAEQLGRSVEQLRSLQAAELALDRAGGLRGLRGSSALPLICPRAQAPRAPSPGLSSPWGNGGVVLDGL